MAGRQAGFHYCRPEEPGGEQPWVPSTSRCRAPWDWGYPRARAANATKCYGDLYDGGTHTALRGQRVRARGGGKAGLPAPRYELLVPLAAAAAERSSSPGGGGG